VLSLLVVATLSAVLAVTVDASARRAESDPEPWSGGLALLYATTCVLALVAAMADRVRRDDLRRPAMRMLLVALAILGAGQAVGYVVRTTTNGVFDPRVDVIPALLCFPFAAYALVRICWPRAMTAAEQRLVVLDCGVAVLALAVLWWGVIVPRWVYPSGPRIWQSIDQVLMFGSFSVAACAGVVSRRVGSLPYPQLVRLLAGLVVYFLSDLAGQLVRGADDATSITYSILGYAVGAWLLAGFALRPPLEPEPARGRRRREQLASAIPMLLALAAGLFIINRASASLSGVSYWASILAWSCILLGVLVSRFVAGRELREVQETGAAQVLSVRTREGWFRALVGDSADSVLVIDGSASVLWASPRFERDADFHPDEAGRWKLADVLLDTSEAEVAMLLTQVSTDPTRSGPYDLLVRSRTDQFLEMEAVIRPIVDVEFQGYVLTARDVSDARRLERQLANSRRRDDLTGLLSREAFLAETAAHLERREPGEKVVVAALDLDRFAALNDGLGHETGDRILVAVAATFDHLPESVRAASRIGSDTFALLVVDDDPEPTVTDVVEQCRGALRGLLLSDGREIEIGFHAGYVVSEPLAARTADWHLEAADLALARCRSARHARLVSYHPGMREETERRIAAEARLRRAIAEDRIEAWYQPVHRLSDGAVTGAEALARLRDTDGHVVEPADFIPLAEEIGLIGEIGRVVLTKAVQEAARISVALGHPLHVAVNIAVDQLTPELVPAVVEVLGQNSFPASRLSLEITESTLADRSVEMQRVLAGLRGLGVVVALDDFGTGYSSLSYLSTLPVDVLKIDRSFVSVMGSSRQSLMLARSVVQLALALDLRTVAEGVETIEQADLLKGMGCDYAQGYLWARPLAPEDYEAYLRGPVALVEAVDAGGLGSASTRVAPPRRLPPSR
jgi:diguanylate cyclase (GGDEF)-like protein/PAS domain S-box-containing protein